MARVRGTPESREDNESEVLSTPQHVPPGSCDTHGVTDSGGSTVSNQECHHTNTSVSIAAQEQLSSLPSQLTTTTTTGINTAASTAPTRSANRPRFACPVQGCGFYGTSRGIRDHMRRLHWPDYTGVDYHDLRTITGSTRWHVCHTCGFVLASDRYRNQHAKTHGDVGIELTLLTSVIQQGPLAQLRLTRAGQPISKIPAAIDPTCDKSIADIIIPPQATPICDFGREELEHMEFLTYGMIHAWHPHMRLPMKAIKDDLAPLVVQLEQAQTQYGPVAGDFTPSSMTMSVTAPHTDFAFYHSYQPASTLECGRFAINNLLASMAYPDLQSMRVIANEIVASTNIDLQLIMDEVTGNYSVDLVAVALQRQDCEIEFLDRRHTHNLFSADREPSLLGYLCGSSQHWRAIVPRIVNDERRWFLMDSASRNRPEQIINADLFDSILRIDAPTANNVDLIKVTHTVLQEAYDIRHGNKPEYEHASGRFTMKFDGTATRRQARHRGPRAPGEPSTYAITKKWGAGAVLLDPNGDIVDQDCITVDLGIDDHNKLSANAAEYAGCILGMELAASHGIANLHIEGDSALVINAITRAHEPADSLIQPRNAIKQLTFLFQNVTATHIDRNDNKTADALATQAANAGGRMLTWDSISKVTDYLGTTPSPTRTPHTAAVDQVHNPAWTLEQELRKRNYCAKIAVLLPKLILAELGNKGIQAMARQRIKLITLGRWMEVVSRIQRNRQRRTAHSQQRTTMTDSARKWTRINSLMQDNELGRAYKTLVEDTKFAPINDTVIQALKDKHPLHDLDDDIKQLLDTPTDSPITVSVEDVIYALRKCKRRVAPGSDGFTAEWYMMFLPNKEDDAIVGGFHPVIWALHSIINRMLAGTIPKESSAYLGGGRLIALLKGDTVADGIRPIVLPNFIRKLADKCIQKVIQGQAADMLAPLQLAVGVSGGAEIMVRTVRSALELHPDYTAVSVDIQNAFNALNRSAMLRKVLDSFPRTRSALRWMYGTKAKLFVHGQDSSTTVIHSETGVQQGSALSSLFFALAISDVITAIHNRHGASRLLQPETDGPAQDSDSHPRLLEVADRSQVVIVFYADDGCFVGPAAAVNEAVIDYKRLMQEQLGLSVQPNKSVAFSPTGNTEALTILPQTQHSHDGFGLMGIPIGSPRYVADWLDSYYVQCEGEFARLRQLKNAKHGIAFLQRCCAPKFQHLGRLLPSRVFKETAIKLDGLLHRGVLDVLSTPQVCYDDLSLTAAQQDQCHFPLRHSGLGIASAALTHSHAFTASMADNTAAVFNLSSAPAIPFSDFRIVFSYDEQGGRWCAHCQHTERGSLGILVDEGSSPCDGHGCLRLLSLLPQFLSSIPNVPFNAQQHRVAIFLSDIDAAHCFDPLWRHSTITQPLLHSVREVWDTSPPILILTSPSACSLSAQANILTSQALSRPFFIHDLFAATDTLLSEHSGSDLGLVSDVLAVRSYLQDMAANTQVCTRFVAKALRSHGGLPTPESRPADATLSVTELWQMLRSLRGKRQHSLTRTHQDLYYALCLKADPSTPWRQASDVARLADLSLDGATSVLTPRRAHAVFKHTLTSSQYRITVQRMLALPLVHSSFPSTCSCGVAMRQGLHLSLCPRGGGRVSRHNAITHLLADFARAHNLFESVDVEPHFVSRSGEQSLLRGDFRLSSPCINLPAPHTLSTPIMADVAIVTR